MAPEGETEAGLRDVVTAVAATLLPGAMLAVPLLSTTLLPRTVPLKAALLCPSPLLLPRDCLLPSTLRWRLLPGLLGTLCLLHRLRTLLLRLLSPLLLRLSLRLLGPLLLKRLGWLLLLRLLGLLLLLRLLGLLPLLRLLSPLLLRLLFHPPLLLCGPRRSLLSLTLLCFGLSLFVLLLLVLLRVRGNNRPQKQTQGSST